MNDQRNRIFDIKTGCFSFKENETGEDYLNIFAVGDLTLARNVEKKIKTHSPQYPFEIISDYLNGFDIVFGNLESPFSINKPDEPTKNKVINFCVDPKGSESIKYAGFNILSIANNHAMDFGHKPMLGTIETLNKLDIHVVGAGKDLKQSRKPIIIQKKGISLGFLAYATSDKLTDAGEENPGTNPFIIENAIADIKDLKNKVDFVLVSIHKGREFMHYPHPDHQKDMRQLINNGADIILGHHPHYPQGIEIYKDKVIFYSLSKFVFDEPYPNKYEALLFESLRKKIISVIIKVSKNEILSYKIVPLSMSKDFQTSLLIGDERLNTLKLIRKISLPLSLEKNENFFYKGGKHYLNAQFILFLHGFRKLKIKSIINYFLWILSDETFKLIVGSYLKIRVPVFILKLKNCILSTSVLLAKSFIHRKKDNAH